MNSWRTTICGALAILASGITLVIIPSLDGDLATAPNWGAFGSAIMAGIGLLFARDNNKSSEDVGIK